MSREMVRDLRGKRLPRKGEGKRYGEKGVDLGNREKIVGVRSRVY